MKAQVQQRWSQTESQSTFNEESRRSTSETDNQRSTCIDKVRRSQVNTTIYLLIVGSQCQQSRWPTKYQTTIRQSTVIGDAKTIYPNSKDCKLIAKRKWKGIGCWTYLESQSNFATVDAVAQRCLSTGTFGDYPRWLRRATTSYRQRSYSQLLLPLYYAIDTNENYYRKLLSKTTESRSPVISVVRCWL